MAADRFVSWGSERPSREQVESVLRNYLTGAAKAIGWVPEQARFYVDLVGKASFPFADVPPGGDESTAALHRAMTEAYAPPFDDRWIEVFLGDDYMDVITRKADDFTNTVADGIAALFVRRWQGRLEQG